MTAGRVIDAVASSARSATLERAELRNETGIIEKFDAATVQERQHVAIEVALGLLRDFIFDAVNPKPFPRPFAGLSIARDLADAVTFQ